MTRSCDGGGSRMSELDPICLKELDMDKAQWRATHNARVFYFCSQECRDRFESMPDFYYKKSGRF